MKARLAGRPRRGPARCGRFRAAYVTSSSLGARLACRASALRTKQKGPEGRASLRQNRPGTRNDRSGLLRAKRTGTPGEARAGRSELPASPGRDPEETRGLPSPQAGAPLAWAPGASESEQGPSSAGTHVIMARIYRPEPRCFWSTRGFAHQGDSGDRFRLLRA